MVNVYTRLTGTAERQKLSINFMGATGMAAKNVMITQICQE